MGLKEIEYDNVDWINLAQNRVQWQATVNTITNFHLMEGRNFLTSCVANMFSTSCRRHEHIMTLVHIYDAWLRLLQSILLLSFGKKIMILQEF
jgi:hypothetical protein